MEDRDQTSTYEAEDLVAAWLDAVDPDTGEVRVSHHRGGHSKTFVHVPETEPRFTDPGDAIVFVEKVLDRLRRQARDFGSNYRGREKHDVQVVEGMAHKKATYRDGLIILPTRDRGGAWALRAMVVLHELAHHLNTGIDGAIIDSHGEGFRATFVQLLEDVGWTEIAAMLREAYHQVGLDRAPAEAADDPMIAKVGKLLRHAEGASTEAEREAFFGKAQELATRHSIELAVARAAHEDTAMAQVPTFESVKLGHRGQQANVRFVTLMLQIASANDLRCTIRSDNTQVTLYGFQRDIDLTKVLYVSLVIQMVADADAYIRSGAHRPTHGRTARAAFYQGWTMRIGQRLRDAQRSAQIDLGVRTRTVEATTGLVTETKAVALVSKEIEVDDFFEYEKRQLGIRAVWRGSGWVDDDHSSARGEAAANRARIGHEKELRPPA